jgi:PTH1 family peptidyl-tRNA hydrolase
VGLGNPGRKYVGTRHNVGWQVLAELARRHAASRPREKFHGEVAEAQIAGARFGDATVHLLCPMTYMNESGKSVAAAVEFYKLELADLLVICDDLSLPVAKLRFRSKGTAGGQKGLQDILRRLGTDEAPRLRIGIGPPPPGWDAADYVLGKFTADEVPQIEDAVTEAATAVEVWVKDGAAECMNQFNG